MMNNQNVEIIKLIMDFLLKAYTDRALIFHGETIILPFTYLYILNGWKHFCSKINNSTGCRETDHIISNESVFYFYLYLFNITCNYGLKEKRKFHPHHL